MKKILSEVLQEIKPTKEEKKSLKETSEMLIDKIKNISSKLDVTIKPKLVGSAARGTWLSKEKDIDIFLIFPKDTPVNEMEEKGIQIGKTVSEGEGTEQYADHPYVKTEIEGFDIDIVPCYDVEDPANIKSAVDRSPHHQKYIEGWLTPEMKDQVLLLKRFLKGIGAYGSELEVHGFSGYLCELLIAHLGPFSNLIERASNWGKKKILTLSTDRSPEELERMFPKNPLIFVDPVDPQRNVAASVSKENYSLFIRACQDFNSSPNQKFFFPKDPTTSPEKLTEIIHSRDSRIFLISLKIPSDLVPDIIYPQLQKTKRTLVEDLKKKDFKVLRGDVWYGNQRALILLEMEVAELPKVREHLGPPLGIDPKPFVQKYLNSEEGLAGPFINEEGRIVFELKREYTTAKKVLEENLKSPNGFGKHIGEFLEQKGYEIYENEKTIKEAQKVDALTFLGNYLTRCMNWYR